MNCYILQWKITIFNGKIHYFYGHFQWDINGILMGFNGILMGYTLWWTVTFCNGKITIFNGKIHYFYGHFLWDINGILMGFNGILMGFNGITFFFCWIHILSGELLHFAMERSTMLFSWENPLFRLGHFQLQTVSSPEGKPSLYPLAN